MLKYVNYKVTFAEVPNEISLCIDISGCPIRCPDCHSKELWDDIGTILDDTTLGQIISNNKGITCVCFLGGDAEPWYIKHAACYVKENFPKLKVAWYSGAEELHSSIKLNLHNFDFIKLGPYNKKLGPLNCETTNQRFYKVKHFRLIDQTYKFWK